MRYILLLARCFITLQLYAGGKHTQQYTMQQLQALTQQHDDAILQTYSDFFFARMRNGTWDRRLKGRCEILFETDTFVYYGYPYNTGTDNMLITSHNGQLTYYKVDKRELQKHFPAYKTVEGYHLRKIVTQYNSSLRTLRPNLNGYMVYDYTYALSSEKILVGATYKRERQLEPVDSRFITYYIYIDMHTMQVTQ